MHIVFFWIGLFFIFYTYVGYPGVLFFESLFFSKAIKKEKPVDWPQVSLVIAAKNEEATIVGRLENIAEQNYPGQLEIIIVSDGSHDNTCKLVQQFETKLNANRRSVANESVHVKLVELASPFGKAVAINHGIRLSSSGIIVFADCRQTFHADAISELVKNFTDPEVGAVSGELIIENPNQSRTADGMGLYWHYEKFIRKKESRTGSVVGATGAIYAIRKSLFCELPAGTLLDDVLTPLNVILQGYRVVFDSTAVAFDTASDSVGLEWSRKVRTLGGNWQLLNLKPELLSPIKNRIFFRFFSHKIFRLLVPFFLIAVLVLIFFAENVYYRFFALIQLAFYFSGILAFLFPQIQRLKVMKLICFFLLLNAAAAVGFYNWIRKRNDIVWKK